MQSNLMLSSLAHTWIFDVDGTICIHNGYKNGEDVLLGGVKEFFSKIPDDDMIILVTSRKSDEKLRLEKFMKANGLRYNHIILDAPMGERILVNDDKPSGLKCAYAINKRRDEKLDIKFKIDRDL